MSKTVLVIGGAGYIGSHMLLSLADTGYKAIAFDNLSRGHALAVGPIPLIVGDLRKAEDLDICFTQNRIDLVMHFAAFAYVGESVNHPELYYQNNVVGAINLLSAMRRHGVDKLVFSSTCASYGEPIEVPISESHPQHPINPYGRSKLMIEQVLADYSSAYHTQSVSLRYFNAAGCDPQGRAGELHDPETHLIPLVLSEAMRIKNGGDPRKTTLQVFGGDFPTSDGSCVRDYIHVTDLCRAHLMASERLLANQVSSAEVYNLANGKGFSVLEVINVCRLVSGQAIQYCLAPRRDGDPAILIGNGSKALAILGWKPDYTELKDIIQSAWDFMSQRRPQI